MTRVSLPAALLLGLLVPGELRAAEPAESPPVVPVKEPALAAPVDEPHRYSPVVQGALGAVAGASLLAGAALVAASFNQYNVLAQGGDGSSCRPCSNRDLAGVRALEYAGYSLLGVGGVVLVVDIVLIGLDSKYRKAHREARYSLAATGAGVRF